MPRPEVDHGSYSAALIEKAGQAEPNRPMRAIVVRKTRLRAIFCAAIAECL